MMLDRKADVFFGDRAILLDIASRQHSPAKLAVLGRYFTYEAPGAGATRGDEEFRLLVDRTLSRLLRLRRAACACTPSGSASPDATRCRFYRWIALPE